MRHIDFATYTNKPSNVLNVLVPLKLAYNSDSVGYIEQQNVLSHS